MQTTIELVTAVRDRYGSDRKAAPHVDVTQATFSDWRNGDTAPTDENGMKIAELLQLEPAYVLAIIRADRAKSAQARKVWHGVARQFAKAASVAVMAIGAASFGAPPAPAHAAASGAAFDSNTHCARSPRKVRNGTRFARVLASLLPA